MMIMRTTRREWLAGLAASGAAISPGTLLGGPADASEPAALMAARRRAANRRRRVIFNNDGDDIWAQGADSVQRFLDVRHKPLLGTHVDSIFYCTTQSFNLFTHGTQVAEVFTAKEGKFANNNLPGFLSQGTDGLRMSSEFARNNGIEAFWTLRMNDIHDAWTPSFRPRWKREDPSRLMSNLEDAKRADGRHRLWSLVDFEHPDVEPTLLKIVDEVLNNYDLDGLELDFLRAPIFFRTGFDGKPATDRQLQVMTRLVRGIRTLVLRHSRRLGKPLLLAARVPTTLELCRKIGIDARAWLQEGLIDLLTLGGGYIAFDLQFKELLTLAHEHHVPAYPCLSQSGLLHRAPRGTASRQTKEAWYGAAARLWHDGADGVYTFNLFPNRQTADTRFARDVLQVIGSPEALADRPAIYAISDAGWWMPSHYWAKDAAAFETALPMELKPNEFERTYLVVPDDLRGAGFDVTAELRIDFTGLDEESTPQILFGSANFGPQKGAAVSQVQRFVCSVPISAIRQGANR